MHAAAAFGVGLAVMVIPTLLWVCVTEIWTSYARGSAAALAQWEREQAARAARGQRRIR